MTKPADYFAPRLMIAMNHQQPLTLEEARQIAEHTWVGVYVTMVASWDGLKAFKIRLHGPKGPIHYLSQFGDILK